MNNQDNQNFNGFEGEDSPGSQSYEQNSHENSSEADAFSDLNTNLPKLGGSTKLGVNKKGLFFLAIVGVVGFALATVVYKKLFSSSGQETQVEREEEIIVPTRDFAAANKERPSPQVNAAVPVEQDIFAQDPLPIPMESAPEERSLPTIAERRIVSGSVVNAGNSGGGGQSGGDFGGAGEGGANPSMGADPVVVAKDVRKINNQSTLLVRGTYIRCVLETRLNSQLSGPTSCVVTDPVYSANGRTLLIERGSRVFGDYRQDDAGVYDRVAILWSRVLTPSGRDIQLNSPGTDSLGGSGHPGRYSAHWGSRLAAAILVSMTADVFNYAGVKYGPTVTTTTRNSDGTVTTSEDSFDSKTADAISKMPEQILAKTLNRPATVTINQGTLINIYTIKDIDFASVLD